MFGVHLLILHFKFQFSKPEAQGSCPNLAFSSIEPMLSEKNIYLQNAQKSPKNLQKSAKQCLR